MSFVINSSVSGMNAQRNLNSTGQVLGTTLQRLSSGLRLNNAKDDAVGLALSERFTMQLKGTSQLARSANDGIAIAQTADVGLLNIDSSLQRMRQIATVAASGNISDSDRQTIQDEAQQLNEEINRVANNTQFNGQQLLDGSSSGAWFQIGGSAWQTIDFSISGVKSTDLGGLAKATGDRAVTENTAKGLSISIGNAEAIAIDSSANYIGTKAGQGADSAFAKAAALNAANISNFTATAKTEGTQTVGSIGGNAMDTYSLSINNIDIYTSQDVSSGLNTTALQDAINARAEETGIRAAMSSAGQMVLSAADGRNISIKESGVGFTVGKDGLTVAGGDFANTLRGKITLSSSDTISIGGTSSALGYNTNSILKDKKGLEAVDLSSAEGAIEALKRIDASITSVNAQRSNLSGIQTRIAGNLDNFQSLGTNMATMGSIRDSEVAIETSNLTKTQMIQQTGIAALAQAKQASQGILALLR